MTGPALALATAVFWAMSSIVMASVARRVGAWRANLLRICLSTLALSAIVLPAYLLGRHLLGHGPPALPTAAQLVWIVLSGLAGLVLGDIFYYEGLVRLGPRRAVKFNTLAPVFTLAIAHVWLAEALTPRAIIGAAMVLGAVAYAAINKPEAPVAEGEPTTNAAEPAHVTPAAIVCGILSGLFIGLGSVLGRLAFQTDRAAHPLDPIVATVLRVASAGVVLWMVPLVTRSIARTLGELRDPTVRRRCAAGTFCGPVAGMLCYVAALKLAPAGVVSTLMSTSTLIVIPLVAVRYKLRVSPGVILAAIIAIAGVGLMTI
ncbi:MAG: DMT family transporter [Phycisphaerae bacterium]|nr:DMT family transporter [Tepidisphaeraceae bacterium]